MPQIMKVTCNGPEKHVNTIDVNAMLQEAPTFRSPTVPERLVSKCVSCTEGKVVITRAMIQEFQSRSST